MPELIQQIQALDTFGEEFAFVLHATLTKFVEEYDNMAQMETIRLATELLESINS